MSPDSPTRFIPRWIPPRVRNVLAGCRWWPAGGAVFGALLVLVAAIVVAGAVAWRARPEATSRVPLDQALPVVSAGSAAPSVATPRSIVIAVIGTVMRPGLVTLTEGARVDDALRAVGGPLPGTDTSSLNLARRVADGEQIVVGQKPSPAPEATSALDRPPPPDSTSGGQLNLNTATINELDQLSGIGPVIAEKIVQWRQKHGSFESVEELRDISGIGEAKFAQLRDQVTV